MIKEIKSLISNVKGENPDIAAEKRHQKFTKEGQLFEAAMQDDQEFYSQQQQRSDLVRWQQDLEEEIDQMSHDFKNEILIEGKWKRQNFLVGYDQEGNSIYHELPPVMNDLGISRIKSYLRPLLSRNLINSNYSEERIYTNLRNIIQTIILHLRDNYYIYEIRKQDLSWIVRQIKSFAEPTMWRCWNNGERKYLTTIHKHIEAHNESSNQQQQQGNKSFFLGGK